MVVEEVMAAPGSGATRETSHGVYSRVAIPAIAPGMEHARAARTPAGTRGRGGREVLREGVRGGLRSASRLEDLDGVARRILQDRLRPSRARDDRVRAERHPGGAQARNLRFEIGDFEMD